MRAASGGPEASARCDGAGFCSVCGIADVVMLLGGAAGAAAGAAVEADATAGGRALAMPDCAARASGVPGRCSGLRSPSRLAAASVDGLPASGFSAGGAGLVTATFLRPSSCEGSLAWRPCKAAVARRREEGDNRESRSRT
jgi:hypothetical protein